MLFGLIKRFFRKVDLLIELSENKISIRVFSFDAKYEDEPFIAIEQTDKSQIVKAIGSEAKNLSSVNVTVSNPFKHSRSFVGDFMLAEKIIQYGVSQVNNIHRFGFTPRVVMHQLVKSEGGLTDIEETILRNLAIAAGAREVLIYQGSRINVGIDDFDSIKFRVTAT